MTQETDPAQSAAEVAEAAATRTANALKLRVSYDDIGKHLGYANRSGAYKAVQKALQDITREPAKELTELELDTLDRMQSSLAKRIVGGDDIAINTGLKIMGQRAKPTGLHEASEDTSNLAEIRAALLGFKQGLGEADLGDGTATSYSASVALELDGILFPGKGGRPGIEVCAEFPSESQVDDEKEARVIGLVNAARSISLETKVRRANPEWDDGRIDEEVTKIRAEENLRNPLRLSPDDELEADDRKRAEREAAARRRTRRCG